MTIPVFKINYTVITADDDIEVSNHFFVRDIKEAHDNIVKLMNDFSITMDTVYVEECSINGVGTDYDVVISVEQAEIFTDEALIHILNQYDIYS